MRELLLLFAVLVPPSLKSAWYRRLLGWQVGKRVRIGVSYLNARHAEIGDDVRIGHFNVMRSVVRFTAGNGTRIGNFNIFTGAKEDGPGWTRTLTIGERVYVASRHFFDVAGDLTVEDRVIVAGRDVQFWTHTVLVVDEKLELTPKRLRVGADCYIGARATLLFCEVPAGTLIGAGSVVTKSIPASAGRRLVAGNPARVVKEYPGRAARADTGAA